VRRPPGEYDLTLRQADQARADFAAIEDGIEFIIGQMSRVATQRQLARVAAAAGKTWRPAAVVGVRITSAEPCAIGEILKERVLTMRG
jgi:hypothetical protein